MYYLILITAMATTGHTFLVNVKHETVGTFASREACEIAGQQLTSATKTVVMPTSREAWKFNVASQCVAYK